MNNSQISIQDRTRNFANRVIKVYVELNKRKYDDAGRVLSKQFLRSGTSIGANCCEARKALLFQSSYDDLRVRAALLNRELILDLN